MRRVCPTAALAFGDRAGGQYAGELDLVLDVAVGVEVPEEAVLVIPDGRDRGDDQPPRAAHLDLLRPEVRVLPGDPVVLLVHADGVRDDDRVARRVVDDESTEVSTGVTESSATSESWCPELLARLQLALRFRKAICFLCFVISQTSPTGQAEAGRLVDTPARARERRGR